MSAPLSERLPHLADRLRSAGEDTLLESPLLILIRECAAALAEASEQLDLHAGAEQALQEAVAEIERWRQKFMAETRARSAQTQAIRARCELFGKNGDPGDPWVQGGRQLAEEVIFDLEQPYEAGPA